MTFWLATTNRHKILEIKSFFKGSFDFCDITHLKNYTPPEETGLTFKENAKIKVKSLATFFNYSKVISNPLILGEDSGLEVFSLNGEPGIHSARYSGLHGNDRQNNQLLLKNMEGQKNRKARYVCALCCLFKNKIFFFEGELKGSIAFKEKGTNGFGYDPLFIPEGEKKTLGELPSDLKQTISHRVRALGKLRDYFSQELGDCF